MKKLLLLILILLPFAAFAQATTNFVPLTSLPGLTSVTSNSTNFVALFNNIYKVCIGAAAALALIMIIYGGATWMMAGDSSEKVSQARKHIESAVFGLLLVLSPVIVFGILNPNILSLNLNVSGIAPSGSAGASTAGAQTTGGPAAGSVAAGGACTSSTQCSGTNVCNTASVATGGGSTCAAPGANTYSCDDKSTPSYAGQCADGSAPVNNAGQTQQGGVGSDCTSNTDCGTSGGADNMVCNDATQTCAPDGPNVYSCDNDQPTNSSGQCSDGTSPVNINGVEAPADGSVAQGGTCYGNEDACASGVCGSNGICGDEDSGNGTDTNGNTVCDYGTVPPGANCILCSDGQTTADNMQDCPGGGYTGTGDDLGNGQFDTSNDGAGDTSGDSGDDSGDGGGS